MKLSSEKQCNTRAFAIFAHFSFTLTAQRRAHCTLHRHRRENAHCVWHLFYCSRHVARTECRNASAWTWILNWIKRAEKRRRRVWGAQHAPTIFLNRSAATDKLHESKVPELIPSTLRPRAPLRPWHVNSKSYSYCVHFTFAAASSDTRIIDSHSHSPYTHRLNVQSSQSWTRTDLINSLWGRTSEENLKIKIQIVVSTNFSCLDIETFVHLAGRPCSPLSGVHATKSDWRNEPNAIAFGI